MKPTKVLPLFLGIIIFFLFQCEMDKPNLPGDLSGKVSDAETSEPMDSVTIGLNQANSTISTTSTNSEGSYLMKKIEPGFYEITASKPRYAKVSQDIEVKKADLNIENIELSLAPWPEINVSFLDFGKESVTQSFTIKNIGSGTLNYNCLSSLDWVEFDHPIGDVSTETDTIQVTINRSALTEDTYKEYIRVISLSEEEDVIDTLHIYLNGLIDQDDNYYKIVTIGTQTWMGDNLNTGIMTSFSGLPVLSDNEVIEKYCFDNVEANCETYGALYSWNEMMDYVSNDKAIENPQAGGYDFHNIQGICPDGWHIPTWDEWETLLVFIGKAEGGVKLKADSPLWEGDTIGTDEFGFSVLPGGGIWISPGAPNLGFHRKGIHGVIWKAFTEQTYTDGQVFWLQENIPATQFQGFDREWAASVRCIKDPE